MVKESHYPAALPRQAAPLRVRHRPEELRPVAAVLLGAGVRLFDASAAQVKLEPGPVTASPRATHLAFRVRR